jgi:hypothetical protein
VTTRDPQVISWSVVPSKTREANLIKSNIKSIGNPVAWMDSIRVPTYAPSYGTGLETAKRKESLKSNDRTDARP